MKLIPLSRGQTAMVDDEDYTWASQFKWSALKIGQAFYAVRGTSDPLRRRQASGRLMRIIIYLHRELLGHGPGRQIDHANRNTLDNRRCNLRWATPSQNRMNRRRQFNKTGFKGVVLSWRGYMAYINKDLKRLYIGPFDTALEAAHAYNDAARELHGEFAVLNILPE